MDADDKALKGRNQLFLAELKNYGTIIIKSFAKTTRQNILLINFFIFKFPD